MSDLIKILLVEDDPRVVQSFHIETRKRPGVSIVFDTGSESQALDFLMGHRVDVIILDIELEEGDGVSFLNELAVRDIEKPFITVVTNSGSSVLLSYMREHGADYIYQKNNGAYSASKVLSIIEKICPYQKLMKERQELSWESSFGQWEKEDDVKRRYIEEELQKMGFKKKYVGFIYIVDAVMILMDYSGIPPRLSSEIYPLIAKVRKVSKESVERSIRNAIEAAFRDINPAQLNRYFSYPFDLEKGRPSNRDFLIGFARSIRL